MKYYEKGKDDNVKEDDNIDDEDAIIEDNSIPFQINMGFTRNRRKAEIIIYFPNKKNTKWSTLRQQCCYLGLN